MAALTTRSPRTTLFQPSPRSICSAEGPLTCRSRGKTIGGAISNTFGRSLCKGRPRFFPFDTVSVTRCVIAPAAAALWLFPRDRAPNGNVGAPTCDSPGRVSAVSLCVSEALAAFALQRALWSHVRLHRHSQSAEFSDRTHFGHLRPPRHGYNEVGVRGRSLARSWS